MTTGDAEREGEGNGTGPSPTRRGPIRWMATNRVAANLLMILLLVGGLVMVPRITKEVFPEARLDVVTVRIPYPGASPEEVEEGVILAVEEAVRGLEGVKEVRSFADDGLGLVNVELLLGADRDQMLDEVEGAVRQITSFPEDAERPVVSLVDNRRNVISLIYAGDVDDRTLRELAEQARDDLLDHDAITFVELAGVRPREIAIEIPRDQLRRYGLSLSEVADRVRRASIDLGAGDLETTDEEVVLRTTEREETAEAFQNVLLVSRPDGTQVRLGDVARVVDGFRDVDREAYFDGERAVRVDVYRVGDETPLEVAAAVKEYAAKQRAELPPTVTVSDWNDISQIYEDRMGLLLENGYIGLALVLLLLGLFLEPRLAFWVTLGIPISFLGALLFMPAADVTINIISLFAFIVTLGLVVDDAIVVGEAIHRRRNQGEGLVEAAISGAREVGRPVIFSILTTCIAFMPMLFVPGVAGQFFRNIPIVVILVLLTSLVESLLILPAHLSHRMPRWLELLLTPFLWLMRLLRSDAVSRWLDRFIERRYRPFARRALRWRYTVLALALLLLAGVVGLVAGGRIETVFLPRIQDDEVRATLRMPVGTPTDATGAVQRRIAEAARNVAEDVDPNMIEGIYSDLGLVPQLDQSSAAPPDTGSHLARVVVDLLPASEREMTSSEFVRRWREAVGRIPEADSLTFKYTTGATAGAPINLRLTHPDEDRLEAAAGEVAHALRQYGGVVDVDDGFARGRPRLDFRLTPEGRSLGLTDAFLARELRGAFFGAETQRFQRGRHEVRVYVRLPEEERRSLDDLDELIMPTPNGGEIPLHEAADVRLDRAFTEIQRVNMERAVNVTAHVVPGQANANEVMASLRKNTLPGLEKRYPRLSHAPGGEQESQRESIGSLQSGFVMAVVAMFGLLAIAFRSYVQPLIVLSAIPFGAVGAAAGHLLLGYDLSLSTMFGLVALSGVIVNDSLLIIVAINTVRGRGEGSVLEAAVAGTTRRFRPILMTSLTTFFGLSPMIFETSVQARFLIPMAVALGFGILFGTLILVFVVPSLYLALEDLRRLVRRVIPGSQAGNSADASPR